MGQDPRGGNAHLGIRLVVVGFAQTAFIFLSSGIGLLGGANLFETLGLPISKRQTFLGDLR